MSEYRVLPAGDTALIIEFGEGIDRHISQRVLALAKSLHKVKAAGVIETVPTFRSLLVCYEPLVLSAASLIKIIDDLITTLRPSIVAGRAWRLPVCYDARLAPDLEDVAARSALSSAQVVERHC